MMARITNSLILCLVSILSVATRASCQSHDRHTVLSAGAYTTPPSTNNPGFIFLTNAPQNSSQPMHTNQPQHSQQPYDQPSKFTPKPQQQYVTAEPSMAASVLDLSKQILTTVLRSDKAHKYLIVSPTSISSALSLALVGARGETFKQLRRTLQLPETDNTCELHEQFGQLLTELVAVSESKNKVVQDAPGNLMNTEQEDEYDNDRDEDVDDGPREHKIAVANALFVQRDFNIRTDYKRAVQNVYQASVNDVDYKNAPSDAGAFINGWVNNATYGKIKQIVSNTNLGPETKMIIASALYFKAEWRKMFIEGANMIRPFFPDGKDGPSYNVEMMAHGGLFPFYQSEELNCRILGFPYAHGESTMYVIMPQHSSREKLIQLQERLNADTIEEMIRQMKNSTSVILFPKLTLSSEMQLKQVLQQTFGLDTLFNLDQSDLSLMSDGTQRQITFPDSEKLSRMQRDVKYKVESSVRGASEPLGLKDLVLRKRISKKNPGKKPFRSKRQVTKGCQNYELRKLDMNRNSRLTNPNLYADEIVHKVELSINERGTEGGAATAITLNRSGTKVVFRADGPFLLLIRHEPTKLPLFYGAIFEPPAVTKPV